jgi:hypothetical protein
LTRIPTGTLRPTVAVITQETKIQNLRENTMIQTSTTQPNNQAIDALNRPFHAAPGGSLAIITRATVFGIAVALYALSASAQTAKDVKGATPLVAIQDEPAVKLIVDPPIPEQLALGIGAWQE